MSGSQDDADMDGDESLRRPSNGGSSTAKTLKRGDACLACRKRRIRCGGERPICATCERLHKACVYESIQSSSRIAKLKGRIAELENTVADLSERRTSVANTPAPHLDGFDTSFDFSNIIPGSSTFGAGLEAPSHGQEGSLGPPDGDAHAHSISGIRDQTCAPALLQNAHHSNVPTFSHVYDSAYGSSSSSTQHQIPYSQGYNPRPLGPANPNFPFDFGLLDTPMMDLSSALGSSTGLSQPSTSTSTLEQVSSFSFADIPSDPFGSMPTSDPSDLLESQPSSGPVRSGTRSTDLLNDRSCSFHRSPDDRIALRMEGTMRAWDKDAFAFAKVDLVNTPDPLDSAMPPFRAPNEDRHVSAGWFDPDDVPPSVRDHLLDLYFGKQGVFHLMINIPRFYTRLTLPLAKRPHPALMYTIYLSATRNSTQPALKALEPRFYEIARAKIEQGIREGDRLLDIVRALVQMTGYLFAKEWYNVGYHMAGQAIRLSIACGLDKIPSSVWRKPPVFNAAIHFTLRAGGFALEPPEDAIDLGERIHAFWAVYEVDQCTAIAFCWEPIFSATKVLTPLPRPLEDYVNGMVSAIDDVRLYALFDPLPKFNRPVYADFLPLRMKAITIFSEAMRLRHLPPEHQTSGDAGDPSSPGSFTPTQIYYGARSVLDNTPCAFQRVKSALDRYCEELPVGHRPPWSKWDEGEFSTTMPRFRARKETSVLWFIIGNAYLALWTVQSLSAENATAVLVARRMASIIGLHIGEQLLGGYAAFIITIWNECAMTLLREIKRREALGLPPDHDLEEEYDLVFTALDSSVRSQDAEQFEGNDVAAIQSKMMEELKSMPKEEWVKAMEEDDKRYDLDT